MTTHERALLEQTATAIFAKACTSERIDACVEQGWDAELWSTLEQSGLNSLSVSDGTLADATTVLRVAAAHSAMVPLAEHLVAAWILTVSGVELPRGPLSHAVGSPVAGYGRVCTVVDTADGDITLRNELGRMRTNLAHEPRDEMTGVLRRISGGAAEHVRMEAYFRAGLFRAVMLTGAAERALELTVQYVREREAFGRPIAQFQAVQQQVAQMAAEVALMRASTDGAVLLADDEGVPAATFAIAAAFATCARSAGVVARIAHQMHGAIGYTYEHVLRHSTLRLWAWRDEDGGESRWAAMVGEQVRHAGGSGLWELLTGL